MTEPHLQLVMQNGIVGLNHGIDNNRGDSEAVVKIAATSKDIMISCVCSNVMLGMMWYMDASDCDTKAFSASY